MHLERLTAWVAGRSGPFLVSEARAAGFSRRCLEQATGPVLKDLGRGLLVSQLLWHSSDLRARHVLHTAAVLRRKRAGWRAARRSSAVLFGLPLMGDPPQVPQLLRAAEGGRTRATSRHERVAPLEPPEQVQVHGIDAVDLARTVHDICREEPVANGLIVADGALRRGLAKEHLVALARKRVHWPGGLRALRVAELANGLHETALESLSWAACDAIGIPLPEPQVRIYLGSVLLARVDGLWLDQHTVGQADGQMKYSAKRDVVRDKLQDESLEDAGLEVVRWGWKTVHKQHDVFESKLQRGFERGRGQQLDPRLRFEATSLEQSLHWTGLIAS